MVLIRVLSSVTCNGFRRGDKIWFDEPAAKDFVNAGIAVYVNRRPRFVDWGRDNVHWWRLCTRWFQSLGIKNPVLMPHVVMPRARRYLICAWCLKKKQQLVGRRITTKLGVFRPALCARCADDDALHHHERLFGLARTS